MSTARGGRLWELWEARSVSTPPGDVIFPSHGGSLPYHTPPEDSPPSLLPYFPPLPPSFQYPLPSFLSSTVAVHQAARSIFLPSLPHFSLPPPPPCSGSIHLTSGPPAATWSHLRTRRGGPTNNHYMERTADHTRGAPRPPGEGSGVATPSGGLIPTPAASAPPRPQQHPRRHR